MDATSRGGGGAASGSSGPGGGYLGGRARPYGRPAAPPPASSRYHRAPAADEDAPEESRKEAAASSEALERSYRAQVTATTVGSLFRYDIKNRVTVPDRSSALVSIINQGVKGADVLYFLTDSGRSNPYRAVRFHNTTGYVLERGPITMYRKGAFVGEAVGGRVEKDALAFVPYALEGRVILHQESRYEDEGMTLVKIDNGYLTVETQYVNKITYKVQNRTGEALTLYVSRPRRDGWNVVEPRSSVMERTVYYAPIPLRAEGETTFTVREQTPVRRTLSLWDSRARQAIGLYLKGAAVSPELAQKLKDVIALWSKLADVETQMSTLNGSIQMLRRREADVRENIRVLGTKANQDLRKKLAETLGTVEKELNGLNRRWVELNMSKGELQQRIQVLLKMIKLG
jgi:prefoldin subunit 5